MIIRHAMNWSKFNTCKVQPNTADPNDRFTGPAYIPLARVQAYTAGLGNTANDVVLFIDGAPITVAIAGGEPSFTQALAQRAAAKGGPNPDVNTFDKYVPISHVISSVTYTAYVKLTQISYFAEDTSGNPGVTLVRLSGGLLVYQDLANDLAWINVQSPALLVPLAIDDFALSIGI
uniref:Uncharacterized protein n=1 Tax=viral metagenome TaxID=1070528 RepID=A0A2V0RIU2_9ZZZZ